LSTDDGKNRKKFFPKSERGLRAAENSKLCVKVVSGVIRESFHRATRQKYPHPDRPLHRRETAEKVFPNFAVFRLQPRALPIAAPKTYFL
jgi:hypothetical protein